MRKPRNFLAKLEPTPGCPTLAWLIAKRVTDPVIELDCTIMILGAKGKGKSMFSVSLGYEISKAIAVIKHKKELKLLNGKARLDRLIELADRYFNMTHIKSVDKEGTLELFDGEVITIENSILLADDFSITANSRDSMTKSSKNLSKIMTVSRPYRNVLILNTVSSFLVDKVARNFSDLVIEVMGIDKKRRRSLAKVYLHTMNQNTGKEYKKFFRWEGKRIKYWACELPPKRLLDNYRKLRMAKTKELIDTFHEERMQKSDANKGKREKHKNDIMSKYREPVLKLYHEGKSIKECARLSPDLTEHWVNRIISTDSDKP